MASTYYTVTLRYEALADIIVEAANEANALEMAKNHVRKACADYVEKFNDSVVATDFI